MRCSRSVGQVRQQAQGFEYPPDVKKRLWQGLQEHFSASIESSGERADVSLTDVKDRLLYIMALETARCLSQRRALAGGANIGSIFGIGFPAWTGGATQFIKHVGVERFERRASELAGRYGERFDPHRGISELSSLIER